MRKKNYKGRCEKRNLSKCKEICKTFDAIGYAYADILEESEDIKEIRCNVPLDGLSIGELKMFDGDFMTDEGIESAIDVLVLSIGKLA